MPDAVFAPEALRLFTLLRRGDYSRAAGLVDQCSAGATAEAIHLNIMLPVIGLAGAWAARGELTPEESQKTFAHIRSILAGIRRQLRRRPPLGLKAVASNLPGEMHGAGLELIGDWLWRDGWDVIIPPIDSTEQVIIQTVWEHHPDLLAISCSIPRQAAIARRIIRTLRATGFSHPIWIGGMAINAYPELFTRSMADDTAPEIVRFTRRLAAEFGYSTATPAEL